LSHACPLTGRLILIAEDEPLIALDVKQTFEEEGAQVIVVRTLNDALHEVEHPALSAAVLDYALGGVDSSAVCARMQERKIPFIVYTGYDNLGGAFRYGVHVKKPASLSELVATVRGLIASAPIQEVDVDRATAALSPDARHR
jgi:DNA-binding response OmpR family regulator